MKKNYLLFLLTVFFAGITQAQETQSNYINYQGLARNAENQLMANENMVIGIDLKIGAAAEAATYSENHSITTDANGVFSLKIGNGNVVSGDYKNFPWGIWATYVTVSINGKEIGTTEMTAVPYALSSGDASQEADEVPYDNSVSGLTATNAQQAIDELVSSGSVDADADPTNEIQTISFDAASNEISLTDGGTITIPGGGTDADADPTNEFQNLSFDAGTNELSLSDGNSVTIPSGGTDADADPTNEIQTISFDAATNEINLTDGGTITIPSGGTDADADPTNEIQDISLAGTKLSITDGSTIDLAPILPTGGGIASGLEAIEQGGRNGWRLIGRNAAHYGDIGNNATDLSESAEIYTDKGATGTNSFAAGFGTKASGNFSVAMGDLTAAIGTMSTALGESTVASATASTAMGEFTLASGIAATSMGSVTKALGRNSTVMGEGTIAGSMNSVALGRYNLGGGDSNNWNADEAVFEIGNGDFDDRSNALTVLKNGRVGIGTAIPQVSLDVIGELRSSTLSGTGQRNVMADPDGKLVIGSSAGGTSLWTENVRGINYSSGNVGIGTETPISPLSIVTGNSNALTLESTNTEDNAWIRFNNRNGQIGFAGMFNGNRDVEFGTVAANNLGKVHLSTGATPRLSVTAAGNVGIGTQNPSAATHVLHNSGVFSPQLKLEESTTGFARLEFKSQAPAFWHIAGRSSNNSATSKLNFYHNDGSAGSNRMTILGNGNVGINNDNPSSTLDVNGSFNITGDFVNQSVHKVSAGQWNPTAAANGNTVQIPGAQLSIDVPQGSKVILSFSAEAVIDSDYVTYRINRDGIRVALGRQGYYTIGGRAVWHVDLDGLDNSVTPGLHTYNVTVSHSDDAEDGWWRNIEFYAVVIKE